MLAAIRAAQSTITFETYIYGSGRVGREFVDALNARARARAGVKVHVLRDWVGSLKMDETLFDEMRSAGIEVERFHEPSGINWNKLNNRTHRKLLVVDGRIGFTGGVGIADPWRGQARDPEEWRDSHLRVEGPVVAQMQSVFLDNWMRAKKRGAAWRCLLSGAETRGRPLSADVQQLAQRRQRDHAADVPTGDYRIKAQY